MIDRLVLFKGAADGGGVSADEKRLMQLFQNRAGLKKAYADLKDEFHLLRDRLKQQEGSTIRVQEQLDSLGELLADPATAYSALVFHQLRGLWKGCHQQLSTFATDLVRLQEARETARHQAEVGAARASRLADVDQRLKVAMGKADLQRQHLAAAVEELGALTAFWHYFERRRRTKSVERLRQAVVLADAETGELHAERSTIDAEVLEDFPGISLSARRHINLAIIAYAELLCETVDAHGDLAARAKEAVARRVSEMNFGTRANCEDYMARVQRARTAVASRKQMMVSVKAKMERLRAICDYRNAEDTVPTADSLVSAVLVPAALPAGGGRAAFTPPPAVWNVLAEDYWDLYTLLMR